MEHATHVRDARDVPRVHVGVERFSVLSAAKPRPHAWQARPVQWRGRGLHTWNMLPMYVTRETSHEFTSELNAQALCSRQATPARLASTSGAMAWAGARHSEHLIHVRDARDVPRVHVGVERSSELQPPSHARTLGKHVRCNGVGGGCAHRT